MAGPSSIPDGREQVIWAMIQAAKAQGLDPAEVLAGLDLSALRLSGPDSAGSDTGLPGLSPEAEDLLARVLDALARES